MELPPLLWKIKKTHCNVKDQFNSSKIHRTFGKLLSPRKKKVWSLENQSGWVHILLSMHVSKFGATSSVMSRLSSYLHRCRGNGLRRADRLTLTDTCLCSLTSYSTTTVWVMRVWSGWTAGQPKALTVISCIGPPRNTHPLSETWSRPRVIYYCGVGRATTPGEKWWFCGSVVRKKA